MAHLFRIFGEEESITVRYIRGRFDRNTVIVCPDQGQLTEQELSKNALFLFSLLTTEAYGRRSPQHWSLNSMTDMNWLVLHDL